MKMIVTGHAGHGKDTVCDYIKSMSMLTSISSSWFMCQLLIFDRLKGKYGYTDPEDCYHDRHNHRSEWFDIIRDYNQPDRTRLGRALLANYDIYNGIRCRDEYLALCDFDDIDFTLWVDASKRLPDEPSTSMTMTAELADYVINNNGSLAELEAELHNLITMLLATY